MRSTGAFPTLDAFIADRWFEDLSFVVTQRPGGRAASAWGAGAARRRTTEKRWVEQKVEVKALAEDRLVAAGTPVAVDAPSLGTVFAFAGGVVRAQGVISCGTRYRVWSYVPDPAPAALAAAPAAIRRPRQPYLSLWGRSLPALRHSAHRDARVDCSPRRSVLRGSRRLQAPVRRREADHARARAPRTRPCSRSSRGSASAADFATRSSRRRTPMPAADPVRDSRLGPGTASTSPGPWR